MHAYGIERYWTVISRKLSNYKGPKKPYGKPLEIKFTFTR